MKKLLFLLLSAAVAVSASAGITTSIDKKVAKMDRSKSKTEQVVRVANGDVVSTPAPQFRAPAKVDIPEGYCAVTLAAGDVWGDGTGYQMLLDADATAYGTIIPETGGLTSSGDASAATYAEFEYKIPENADGSMSTPNFVLNNSITIVIPAGVYDYCITNPTPGDRIWIASDQGDPARADDFEFEEGVTYVFTLTLEGSNDCVTMQILYPGYAGTTPENVTVTPGSTDAYVAWDDNDDPEWNLRWRPFVDTSGNPVNITLHSIDTYMDEIQDVALLDLDQDGYGWGLVYSDDTNTDICFTSASYADGYGLTPDNWLIMPLTKLQGKVSFTAWNRTNSYPEKLQVMIGMEDAIEGNLVYTDQFTTIANITLDSTTPKAYNYDLSSYGGVMGYVVFRHTGTTDMWEMYLDDIFIGDPNAEITPAAEWNYEYGLTDTHCTITGLTPETEYEVQVQVGYNGEGLTAWTPIVNFITLAEGPAGKIGDVNKDGFVRIDDVTALIDALLASTQLDETANYSPDNANVNGDDTVSIADVTALIDMLLNGLGD